MSLKIRKETTASGLTYAHVEVFGQITAEIANEIMAATHQGGAFSGLPRLYLSDQNTELPSEAREIFKRQEFQTGVLARAERSRRRDPGGRRGPGELEDRDRERRERALGRRGAQRSGAGER